MAHMTPRERLKAWSARFPTMERAAAVAHISRAALFYLIEGKHEPSKKVIEALNAVGAVPYDDWFEEGA